MNIAGNVISGQVMGDTAKQLSERFGRILQQRESRSIEDTQHVAEEIYSRFHRISFGRQNHKSK